MMIQTKIKAALEWVEDHLRRMCGEITPDKRLIVVLIMLILFTGLSLYITVSSIYRIGKSAGENKWKEQIEQIEELFPETPREEILPALPPDQTEE